VERSTFGLASAQGGDGIGERRGTSNVGAGRGGGAGHHLMRREEAKTSGRCRDRDEAGRQGSKRGRAAPAQGRQAGRGLSFRAASSLVPKRGRAEPAQGIISRGGKKRRRRGGAGIGMRRGGKGRKGEGPNQRRASPHEAGESEAGVIFSGGIVLCPETGKGSTSAGWAWDSWHARNPVMSVGAVAGGVDL